MADEAEGERKPAVRWPLAVALCCAAAGYWLTGAPGLSPLLQGRGVDLPNLQETWLPALHLFAAAAAIAGGWMVARILRGVGNPGLVPLTLFAFAQPALLGVALSSVALAATAIGMRGDWIWAGIWGVTGLAALRVHPDMYMSLLRQSSLGRSPGVEGRTPIAGGTLIALTLAANLIPLTLLFQTLTTHLTAMVSVLHRRAVLDPAWYVEALSSQALSVSAQESAMALAAGGVSVLLAVLWAYERHGALNRLRHAEAMEANLTPSQADFLDSALQISLSTLYRRASAARYLAWTVFWLVLVVPAGLAAAYAGLQWFDAYREVSTLSWVSVDESDFINFAVAEAGYGRYLLAAAATGFVLFMGAPLSLLLVPGGRYDRMAFAEPAEQTLRARLLVWIANAAATKNQAFDVDEFVDTAASRAFPWTPVAVTALLFIAAAATAWYDLGRSALFTSQGVVVADSPASPRRMVRYEMVQAVAISCNVTALGAQPSYQLTLPDARVVEMIGAGPLPQTLDRYLSVNDRLLFSGSGFAYPPSDMDGCLKAIEAQYNPMIAAGMARLLHVL